MLPVDLYGIVICQKISGEISISEGSEDWFQSTAQSRVNRDGVASYDIRPNHMMPAMTTPGILRAAEDISLRSLFRQHRVISYEEDVMKLDLERARMASSSLRSKPEFD